MSVIWDTVGPSWPIIYALFPIHTMYKCTDAVIQSSRIQNLSKYYQPNPNVIKFENLFNVTKKKELIKICKFLDTIIERVISPG